MTTRDPFHGNLLNELTLLQLKVENIVLVKLCLLCIIVTYVQRVFEIRFAFAIGEDATDVEACGIVEGARGESIVHLVVQENQESEQCDTFVFHYYEVRPATKNGIRERCTIKA